SGDEDRAFANVPINADRLAILVVDRIYLRQTPDHEPAAFHTRLALQFAAYNLFNRDTVDLRREDAHEINRAAGTNPGLEAIPAQVGEQLDHWLVSDLCEWAIQFRVSPPFEEPARLGGKPLLRHPGLRGDKQIQERLLTSLAKVGHVAFERGLER